jgi:hypothetical protein
VCKCVLLPPGVNPIAIKYIISKVQRVFRRQFTVGRHGLVPSRNTIPDFFLWGFMKDRVIWRRIRTIQELKQAIVEEVAAIDKDLRRRVYGNFKTSNNALM